jgi:Domain of unknown function (DUF4340)
MNLRTTLALFVLAAAGGAVLWFGASLPPALDPIPKAPPFADAGSRGILDNINPDTLTFIQIIPAGRPAVELRRSGASWMLPGNWPVNPVPVKELTELLGGLRPRFEPESAADSTLRKYGLDHPAITVHLATTAGEHTLEFSRKPTATSDPFTQETYVRVDNKPEVLRLGPGLIDELDRPADAYQQRRLFPKERTAKEANSQEKGERLEGKSLTVTNKTEDGSTYSLKRGADGWELSAPARDRLEPRTRDALLAAVPDLWAERFVAHDVRAAAAAPALCDGGLSALVSGLFWASVNEPNKAPQWLVTRAGLASPERTVSVTRDDGSAVELLIGKSAGSRPKKVMRQPPPGVPGQPIEVDEPEDFLYAKLKDNPQIFEIKADRLKDVFVAVDALRDPQLAHFSAGDATRLEISQNGQDIVLIKDKDQWRLDKPLHADADRQKVTDLLNRLSGLEARGKDVLDGADPKTYGLEPPAEVVKVTVEEKAKEVGEAKEKAKPTPRVLTFRIGKHDDATKKVYVQLADWPRVNALADGTSPGGTSLTALVKREPREYRGKRLFEFSPTDLATITVSRETDPQFVFNKSEKGDWRLSVPPAVVATETDAAEASKLASSLGNLEALEYVNDTPKADELEPQYGLGMPALTVRLDFADKTKPSRTLQVGKAQNGKPGRFARIVEADSIFAVAGDVFTTLDRDALAYLPRQLWGAPPPGTAGVRVHRKDQPEYMLKASGAVWKIAGPFEADAAPTAAQALADALTAPHVESYKAFDAKNPAEYGLDAPFLTVALTAADGKEHTLTVGGATAKDAKTRYAQSDKKPAVFVVGEPLVASLDKPALDFLDRTLFAFDANAITGLSLHKPAGGDVELVKADEGWKLVKPNAESADEKSLQDLLAQLSHLHAARIAEYPAKNLEDFGLAKPDTIVTIRMAKDAKPPQPLLIGKPADATTGDRFAMVEGAQSVAVIPAPLARRLTAGALAFRDRTLVKSIPDPDHVRLDRDPRKAVFSKVEGSWKMTEPLTADLDQDAMDDFLNSLLTLRADELIAEKPTPEELKTHGLDKPEVKWRLQNGDKDLLTLLVGKTEKNGPRAYARLADRDMVFLLDPRLTAKALGEFRLRTVWTQPLDAVQVVGLTYKRAEGAFTLTKGDDGWKAVGKPDAKIDTATVEEALAALAGLKLERYVMDQGANLALFGLAPPELTVEVTTKAGQKFTLNLGRPEGESKRRYAHEPASGKTDVFLLSEADGEKIVRDLPAFGKPPTAPASP